MSDKKEEKKEDKKDEKKVEDIPHGDLEGWLQKKGPLLPDRLRRKGTSKGLQEALFPSFQCYWRNCILCE